MKTVYIPLFFLLVAAITCAAFFGVYGRPVKSEMDTEEPKMTYYWLGVAGISVFAATAVYLFLAYWYLDSNADDILKFELAKKDIQTKNEMEALETILGRQLNNKAKNSAINSAPRSSFRSRQRTETSTDSTPRSLFRSGQSTELSTDSTPSTLLRSSPIIKTPTPKTSPSERTPLTDPALGW